LDQIDSAQRPGALMSEQPFQEPGGALAAPRPRRRRLRFAAVAAALALVIASAVVWAAVSALVTGCSSGAAAANALNPATEIKLAAGQTQKLTSLAGTVSYQTSGKCTVEYDPENGTSTSYCSGASGTFQLQLKPSLMVETSLNVGLPVEEILTGTDVYLKMPIPDIPQDAAQASKPWFQTPLPGHGGDLSDTVNQMVQEAVEYGDPLTLLQEITASKNARETGTEVINGVNTTCYTGTLTPSAAAGTLSPSLGSHLDPDLKAIQGDISWSIWTDSQHRLRKLTENYTQGGTKFSQTITVTSINQPVTVKPPPPSQVTVLTANP
jgi:hypothetical protein